MAASDHLRTRLDQLEQRLAGEEPVLNSPIAPAAVRAHVTKVVIWLFVAALLFVGLALACPTIPDARVALMLELIKTAILPVVTFVIGHYFGSKST